RCFHHYALPHLLRFLLLSFSSFLQISTYPPALPSSPTRRSSDLLFSVIYLFRQAFEYLHMGYASAMAWLLFGIIMVVTAIQLLRSEEHTSELQSRFDLVCRLLLVKKNLKAMTVTHIEPIDQWSST